VFLRTTEEELYAGTPASAWRSAWVRVPWWGVWQPAHSHPPDVDLSAGTPGAAAVRLEPGGYYADFWALCCAPILILVSGALLGRADHPTNVDLFAGAPGSSGL
jgi:hypothetical protein